MRESTQNWFGRHNHLFRKQTDGVFYMEYNEEEFAKRLYDAIGVLDIVIQPSRVSAGMVFLSHGVGAAGRILHKPKKQLGKRRLTKLRENIPLLNEVAKLLREREIKRKVFIY